MKLITHTRDKIGDFQSRVLLHIPIGILIGIPILGYPILKLFISYEDSEDYWVHDFAWKDYAGAIVGACITVVVIIILGVLWLMGVIL